MKNNILRNKPWAHFIAICGPSVGGVAVMLKDLGWKITGSDLNNYPPAGTFLEKNGIRISLGFKPQRLNKNINQVVLGGGALILDRDNPEVKKAIELGLSVRGWPQIVAEKLVKAESVVVAGTYGKTTTTAMVTFILRESGYDPSYLIGGFANDFSRTAYIGKSAYSVVEGDEHPAVLHFDKTSKFLYYKPKYVILTSAKWDHYNVFPRIEGYVKTYIELVKLIPENGLLLAAKDGENLNNIIKYAKCKVIRYSAADFPGKLGIIGDFNRENAAAALLLTRHLGVPDEKIKLNLSGFKGVKRRLDKRFESKNILVVEDFAQHPYKIKEVIKTLKSNFPGYKIISIFDPNASILRTRTSLPFYKNSFDESDKVILRKIKIAIDKTDRVTGPELIKALCLPQGRAVYIPLDNEIIEEILKDTNKTKSLILFLSSGDWHGLIERIISKIS